MKMLELLSAKLLLLPFCAPTIAVAFVVDSLDDSCGRVEIIVLGIVSAGVTAIAGAAPLLLGDEEASG